MNVKPNGTDAKEIALNFYKLAGIRATPGMISRTVVQAKNLLQSGYSKKEITSVMEYAIKTKKLDIYSLGFFSSAINGLLRELDEIKKKEESEKNKQSIQESINDAQSSQRSEVRFDDESTRRNQEKARRINLQSRIGTKFDFDMLKGHGQDN